MGTHGAIILDVEDGTHYCVEVTGSGDTISNYGREICTESRLCGNSAAPGKRLDIRRTWRRLLHGGPQ